MNKNILDQFLHFIERIMNVVLVKILHLKFSEQAWTGLVQFVKFGVVGVTNTIIGYGTYAGSLKLLRLAGILPGYDYYAAHLISFFLSVLWSFYWNNKAVFKQENGEHRNVLAALLKTYVSYAFTSLFLSGLLLMLWVDILGINEYAAPLLSLFLTIPLNFLIQKFWAFKGS